MLVSLFFAFSCVHANNASTLFIPLDDPNIRVLRSLNETELSKRHGPAGPGGEKYIETLVVVDPKMANFHGEDAAKQYALSACNIVCKVIHSNIVNNATNNNDVISNVIH